MEMRFTGDENAPKVRKPYTITKQRERWTQDEHNKFLEALKLYGRAWRRIEAHVGTKTAVQIRSHAQKFFSKVVRESTTTTTDGVESIKPVDIPPPRPKRKPSHPYPRKPANSTAEQSSFIKSQVSASSSSPHESTYVEENGSPTSLLSAMDDEVMELSGSISPDSCTTTPYQILSDSGSKDDNIFAERQNSSSPAQSGSVVLNPDVSEDNSSVMDFWRAEGNVETPTTCLKLFGKTVKIVDANNTASSASNNTENCHSASKSNIEPSCVGDWSGVSAEVKENADTKQDSGVSSTDWLPPAFCYWPYSQTHTDPSLNIIPPFMFPFYLPFPFVHNLGSNSMQPAPPADNGESQTDGSSCSISQSAGIETEWPKCRGDEKNTSLDKPVKGFVPYKR